MNLQQLNIIVELGNGRTLQEIAAKLNISQPTVSFHLRKLEEALGVELVHKHSRYLRMTEAAGELLPYARRIIALLEEAKLRMDERRKLAQMKLRLGASYTPATFFLPPYLQEFQGLHPSMQFMITVNQANKILGMLRQYEIDAAIVSLPDIEEQGLVIRRLMADELKLVFSPAHPLAERNSIEIDDLRGQTFLLHEIGSTSRNLTDEWASEVGLQLEQIMELGAIETIKEVVKFGIGIGVLPERSVMREAASGELMMRSLPGYRNRRFISLAYRDEDLAAPQVRSFVHFALSRMMNGS
ncbi:LysR family transcriptional regulator [Marinicrinis lubricantis]|uniref:LysR family transcriptional regulator n=1 Tax=Marinicrinis lubricantis TaxID=2086470 RepID=A0ABW1ISS2_9BACL